MSVHFFPARKAKGMIEDEGLKGMRKQQERAESRENTRPAEGKHF